jgi:hypothetical protein
MDPLVVGKIFHYLRKAMVSLKRVALPLSYFKFLNSEIFRLKALCCGNKVNRFLSNSIIESVTGASELFLIYVLLGSAS